jgi:succinoglycan biosynthesis protein ExoM
MTGKQHLDRQEPPAVVIAVLTYRRPDDLAAAIPALLAEARTSTPPATILVVDNDPAASAEEVTSGFAEQGVRYVHEPVPGIAAARNRALDSAGDRGLLIFIDDDEHPLTGWLSALLTTHAATGAAAVAGAVVSEYESAPDEWLVAGRFFDRRRPPTGTRIDVAATNNLLLDLSQVAALGLRFDDAFGLTGGSDTLFTRHLVRAGRSMVWCNEAIVVDRVPAARLTREWVLKRAFRSGNTAVRVSLVLAGSPAERTMIRVTASLRGSLRIAGGGLRVGLGALTGSIVHRARGRRAISRGAGMLNAAYGRVSAEYARLDPAPFASPATPAS